MKRRIEPEPSLSGQIRVHPDVSNQEAVAKRLPARRETFRDRFLIAERGWTPNLGLERRPAFTVAAQALMAGSPDNV